MCHRPKKLLCTALKVIIVVRLIFINRADVMLLDPDAGGIPSQFPVQEDTQFCQILREALDFFGIEESKHEEYFLVDYKTRKCDFFLYK